MSEKATIDKESGFQPEAAVEQPAERATGWPSVAERWLSDRQSAIALGIVAAGLGVRLWTAARSYLNPDEALHYYLINQPSVIAAYKASLTNAHPPLLFLILYFWHLVGRSEFLLRLPSVFAGAAFCWLTFKWMAVFFGRAAALIALVVVTFAPAMIEVSGEVREYALLLCCMAAALYFLGSALRDKSTREMWYFSALLYLAILSHYSAAFFALTVGIYAIVRMADSSQPRRVVATWLLGQLGALAIYAFLYWTHVAKVRNVVPLWAEPFDRYYFRLGHESFADLLDFLRANTAAIFRYMFRDAYASQAVFLLFVAGTVFLFIRGFWPPRGTPRSCHLAILVSIPFLAVWGAAVQGIYPYIGSRHTAFLLPFAVAAVSFLLAAVVGNRLWASLALAVALMGFSSLATSPFTSKFTDEGQRRPYMLAAMAEFRQSIPKSELVLVDYQSSALLTYYLCGPQQNVQLHVSSAGFYQFECSGYSIISLEYHFWNLTPANFMPQARKMAQSQGLRTGARFWVFQAGWGRKLDAELREHQEGFACLASRRFGSGVAIIPFVLDANLSPASPVRSCAPQESHGNPE